MGWWSVVKRLFQSPKQAPTDGVTETIIVGRGLSSAYYFFIEIFAKQNSVNLLLDRRVAERRRLPRDIVAERRVTDRRGPMPTTWSQEDFVSISGPRRQDNGDKPGGKGLQNLRNTGSGHRE